MKCMGNASHLLVVTMLVMGGHAFLLTAAHLTCTLGPKFQRGDSGRHLRNQAGVGMELMRGGAVLRLKGGAFWFSATAGEEEHVCSTHTITSCLAAKIISF